MIAVVIGRPISGGSALASAIVAMGYHPGLRVFGPCAPSFRPDWEDVDITPYLIAGARPDAEDWRMIMEARLKQAAALGCSGTMMKSPMFCLCDDFWSALQYFTMRVFWVSRDEDDRMDALKTYPAQARKTLKEIDEQITDELEDDGMDRASLLVAYEDLVHSPVTTLTPVARMLGAEDRLTEAVAAIGPRRLS